jgi:hypothetical protein
MDQREVGNFLNNPLGEARTVRCPGGWPVRTKQIWRVTHPRLTVRDERTLWRFGRMELNGTDGVSRFVIVVGPSDDPNSGAMSLQRMAIPIHRFEQLQVLELIDVIVR